MPSSVSGVLAQCNGADTAAPHPAAMEAILYSVNRIRRSNMCCVAINYFRFINTLIPIRCTSTSDVQGSVRSIDPRAGAILGRRGGQDHLDEAVVPRSG